MRGALLIAKKEFMELSKDRKTLFFVFVMPFILYPAIFGMMAKLGKRDADQNKNKASRIFLIDASNVIAPILKADAKQFELVAKPEGDLKQAIRDQKLELALVVDPSAAASLQKQETFTVTATLDESEHASNLALKRLKGVLGPQEKSWVQKRLQTLSASSQLAEPLRLDVKNAADDAIQMGKVIGMMLPYMLMIMMFTGSMQHGIYATAGEKERNTLLSLMTTRMPRIQIILGKLLYIFSIGVISALLNLLSLGISIPVMGGGSASSLQAMGAIASPMTLGFTFLIMVPLGLIIANFILLMGIQAKSTVEAGTAIMPGMFLVIFLGVFTMAPGVDKMTFLAYVPVVNVCIALRKIFSQQPNWGEYAVAFVMTVGFAGLMTWLSTRILNREQALFKM